MTSRCRGLAPPLLLLLASGGCTPMKSLYERERQDALQEHARLITPGLISEEEWGEDGDYPYRRGTIQEVRLDVRQ
jgi:hypothetical protein